MAEVVVGQKTQPRQSKIKYEILSMQQHIRKRENVTDAFYRKLHRGMPNNQILFITSTAAISIVGNIALLLILRTVFITR